MIRASKLRQATLMTIIDTKVYMILETLVVSFEMTKEILKDYKGVHMRVKVLQVLLLRIR